METQQMITMHKQILRAVTRRLLVDIHQQRQTPTVVDKQTQQQAPLHLLPMGQMYQSIQLTLHHTLQCLKMFVVWVLAVLFLLWGLAYLAESM